MEGCEVEAISLARGSVACYSKGRDLLSPPRQITSYKLSRTRLRAHSECLRRVSCEIE